MLVFSCRQLLSSHPLSLNVKKSTEQPGLARKPPTGLVLTPCHVVFLTQLYNCAIIVWSHRLTTTKPPSFTLVINDQIQSPPRCSKPFWVCSVAGKYTFCLLHSSRKPISSMLEEID